MVKLGGEGKDTLTGTAQDDTLRGLGGDDSLVGDEGGDLLEGGDGNDTLRGDRGFDTLKGGAGDDTYLINDRDDYWVEAADGGFDTLIISANGVKLDLTNIERVLYVDDALPLAYWIDALVYGISFELMGEPATVRYAFLDSSTQAGFNAFTDDDRTLAREVLAVWAAPTRLTWREVAVADADVVFGFADLRSQGAAGITDYGGANEPTAVFIDNTARGGALRAQDYWFDVMLHEVGHAIWLKHPGNYNGTDGHGTAPFLGATEDNMGSTVMSYNAAPAGADPMRRELRPFDVAAAQYLHGVNPAYNGGDTLWDYSSLLWPHNLIADGSGIDTLSGESFAPHQGLAAGLVIELRAGARSYPYASGWSTQLISAPGQVAINYGSVIENAIGSTVDDRITGNEVANRLDGGAGDDTLQGLDGADTLLGGSGNDLVLDDNSDANLLGAGDGDDLIRLIWAAADASPVVTIDGGSGRDELRLQLDPSRQPLDVLLQLQALLALPQAEGVFSALGLSLSGVERIRLADDSGEVRVLRPIAQAASATLDEDAMLRGTLPLAVDLGGQSLSYGGLFALHGTVLADPTAGERGYVYRPAADYAGDDILSYTVLAANGLSTVASIELTIRPVDDAPILQQTLADAMAAPGVSWSRTVSATTFIDRDSARVEYSATLASGAPLPSWLRFDAATLTFTGTPALADAGVYAVRLSANASTAGAFTDFILGVHATANASPAGRDAQLEVNEDAALEAQLPAAADADGDAVSYKLDLVPRHGVLVLLADGHFRFVPDPDYSGPDSFSYLVQDGRGGSARYEAVVTVRPVNDPPSGRVVTDGQNWLGATLYAYPDIADIDGVPVSWHYDWLRDGAIVASTDGQGSQYQLMPADVGKELAVRLTYIDAAGFVNSMESVAASQVRGAETLTGSSGDDNLPGSLHSIVVSGLGGNDRLGDSPGGDRLDGGSGNDTISSFAGSDTISGGDGWDVLYLGRDAGMQLTVDLQTGLAQRGNDLVLISGIEVLGGANQGDVLKGRDGAATAMDDRFILQMPGVRVDGRGGVDMAQILMPSTAVQCTRQGDQLVLTPRSPPPSVTGNFVLENIERLRFDDVLLAFGTRAEEVARVAFALWSKDIAGSQYLFARGISYYDVGYRYDEMIHVALGFYTSDSEHQFAARLASNVPTGRSAADILALMQSHGGAGPGEAGRDYVTRLLADDPVNVNNLQLSGLISNGIACDLVADGHLLFAALGG